MGEEITLATTTKATMDAWEVWTLLGIGRRTFFRLKSKGEVLAPVRLGRRTVWWRDEVMAWRNAGCPSPKEWQRAYRAQKKMVA